MSSKNITVSPNGTFRAHFKHDGVRFAVGTFYTESEAQEALRIAKRKVSRGLGLREIGPVSPGEYFRSFFSYDPDSGLFEYRRPPTGGSRDAKIRSAGFLSRQGYVRLSCQSRTYMAHRVAWAMMTDRWPQLEVDHINRDRADNRFCNLRLATNSQNRHNSKKRKDGSASRFKGVTYRKPWIARINVEGERIHLGCFNTESEAAQAYKEASQRLLGEFSRTE